MVLLACTGETSATIVYTDVSADSLTVGDRVVLSVGLVVPKAAQVVPPGADVAMGEFVVKDFGTAKTERTNADSLTFRYTLTTYSVKPCTIPALPFIVISAGSSDTLHSRAMPMVVGSVLPSDTVDIKDLKAPQVTGKAPLWWLWALLGALAAGVAAWFLRRALRRGGRAATAPPPLPPYEEAIAAFKKLEDAKYLMKGLVREYAFELSEIVKRYIERRFEVKAAEFTTEEMLAWVRHSPLAAGPRASAEWFFAETDPVKFAKLIPPMDVARRFGEEARSFVEATKPVIEQPQTAEKSAQAGQS